jgi:hypothetical protein
MLTLLTAFVVLALLGVFGERSSTSTVRGAAGSLSLRAPSRVRGGLLYQASLRIHAFRALGAPVLVFDRGWFDQTTVNSLIPEPTATTSDGKHLKLRFEPLAPGRTLLVYLDFQANPTNVGSHAAGVALYDGSRRVASIDRTQIDFP